MRNKSLDAAKAVAAFLVVCIHVSFPGQTGQIIKVFARCAVPFFFMISGYFCYYENRSAAAKIPLKMKHITKLFVGSVLFYFAWEFLIKTLCGEDVSAWLKGVTDIAHLKEFIICNSTSPVRAHLWFLPALLYCYAVDFIIEKWKLRKAAYCCIPVLLAILLWRAEFCRFAGVFYRTMEYRNFLFTGMSFFLAGQMIHENQNKLELRKTERLEYKLVAGIMAGCVCCVIEYCLQGTGEIYTGNCLLIFGLFIWFIVYGKKKTFPQILAETGRKFAFSVYLLHPAVADIAKKISAFAGIDGNVYYQWMKPILVYVVTLSSVYFVHTVSKTVHKAKNMV